MQTRMSSELPYKKPQPDELTVPDEGLSRMSKMKATPRCSASRPDRPKPDVRETQLMIEASESRKRELLTRLLEIDTAMASVGALPTLPTAGSGTQPRDLDAHRRPPPTASPSTSDAQGGLQRGRMSRAGGHVDETFTIALQGLQAELENVRKCKGTLSTSEAQDAAGTAAKPTSSEEERQVLILRQMQQLLTRCLAFCRCVPVPACMRVCVRARAFPLLARCSERVTPTSTRAVHTIEYIAAHSEHAERVALQAALAEATTSAESQRVELEYVCVKHFCMSTECRSCRRRDGAAGGSKSSLIRSMCSSSSRQASTSR
jgi:hypothetical protein